VFDSDRREVAQYADTVLPLATHAESDGTFTNAAGRVQRFHAAIDPPGEARPGWHALGELLAAPHGGDGADECRIGLRRVGGHCLIGRVL
jgi:predicted molibdopterin-dependent oxidoreductase YjgC